MRLLSLILLSIFSINVLAVEPIDEQQVMAYYTIPLGTVSKQESRHEFGLRLDQVSHSPYDTVQISQLQLRPAAFNLSMDSQGVKSLSIHGREYAAYLVAMAAEGEAPEATPEETPPEAAAPEAAAPEQAPQETAAKEEKSEEPGKFDQAVKDMPLGVIFGVILAVGLVVGAGG